MATVLKSKPTTVTVSTSSLQVTAGALASGSFQNFEQSVAIGADSASHEQYRV